MPWLILLTQQSNRRLMQRIELDDSTFSVQNDFPFFQEVFRYFQLVPIHRLSCHTCIRILMHKPTLCISTIPFATI
ncbi:hypothetical protein AYI68_g7634 [Smittium mucronatum]|uniref:Uncharacterized protein n=1 Tax=Smittium mucronatum TaxID=133383 RepID=A0A1R0GN58_9FUNG|nr:hypothetical protein AYI68_g7634 [Smittium mucronatum]